jgi:IS5 family transposase
MQALGHPTERCIHPVDHRPCRLCFHDLRISGRLVATEPAGVRAKVEHPFRVLKQQFGYTKTRYRGSVKNTAQITTLFALGNLWMARKALSKA